VTDPPTQLPQLFLIHGMGRTPRSLGLLAWRLERAGLRTSRFGYRVREHTVEQLAARFAAHVHEHATGPYAIVGHSLGNVIARLASPRLPPGLSHFVMLAPPNRPARLARLLGEHTLTRGIFGAITRDAGRRLAEPAFFEALPIPDVPTLVFAGTAGPRAPWLPFGGARSDGIVAVDETFLVGSEHREVRAIHTLIMNDTSVAKAIAEFVRS
jgi:pimeloyl-ACP methyl ester carboxylesterase